MVLMGRRPLPGFGFRWCEDRIIDFWLFVFEFQGGILKSSLRETFTRQLHQLRARTNALWLGLRLATYRNQFSAILTEET
jgi:hypothetical protein